MICLCVCVQGTRIKKNNTTALCIFHQLFLANFEVSKKTKNKFSRFLILMIQLNKNILAYITCQTTDLYYYYYLVFSTTNKIYLKMKAQILYLANSFVDFCPTLIFQ